MRDKMEVLKLAPRARQFHCAITKHFNAKTKEKSSGTCEHVIQSKKENSMEGY